MAGLFESGMSFSFDAAMARRTFLSSLILIFISIKLDFVLGEAPYAVTQWTKSHATFYGGAGAGGTMGGACGYNGNLYNTGYGLKTAALSQTLFNGGLSCGACFEIKCITSQSKWCYKNAGSIKITGTNLCPPNWNRIKDGWCNPPRTHFDLSYPMFAKLAQRVGGIIPVQYRRIPCVKTGGIRYTMDGNPWFNLVLVWNVAGGGNVVTMHMKGKNTQFYNMRHNWGAKWELKQRLHGQAVSFRATLGNGKQLTSTDVCPKSWGFGQSYECVNNF